MHARNIAARNADARRRISAAAASLADALAITPLGAPTAIERRQFDVAQMRELEHIAELLERVATALVEVPHGSQEK